MAKNWTNVIVIALLSAILLALYTMPRFNFRKLSAEVSRLQSRQTDLETAFKKLEPFLGDDSSRIALLDTLDSASALLEVFQTDSYTLFEELGEMRDALRTQARTIEQLRDENSAIASDGSGETLGPELTYAEARDASARFSSRRVSEWDFSRLLEEIVNLQWTDYERVEDFPREIVEDLAVSYSTFKMNVELIRHDERVSMAEWLQESTETGNYSDVPLDDLVALRAHGRLSTKGLLHVKTFPEAGVKRFYGFPVEDYPELREFNARFDEAKARFIDRVYGIVKNLE